jgi:serine protease Do
MPNVWWRAATVVAALVVCNSGAGTEARAQYARRTPIVEAVQKTRASIVTVKVEKRNGLSRKEVVGTGVIVDERGYIVTNDHVLVAADHITVILADGTELLAKVVRQDAGHDLAILRVQSRKPLHALALGPGSDLLVGETVVAVGHPFGYTNTVSTGIISALDREIALPTGEVLKNLIQTNASINPGNSGGPLLNINGELIGINVALREGAQGIAFALNADTVKQVLAQHLSAHKMAGVQHGLTCVESVAPEGKARQRVVVGAVADKGPAAAAGLQKGDEILRVADRSVSNRFDLERALWEHKPGDAVELLVVRQGTEMTFSLKLTRGSDIEPAAATPK